MKTKVMMIPLSNGCHVEGANLGIQAIKDCLPTETDILDIAVNTGSNDIEVIADVSQQIAESMEACFVEGVFPLMVGGDHSLGIGSVAGASTRPNVGILWFDAHGDINSLQTTTTFRIHGMPLAVSLGLGYPELVDTYYPGAKITNEQIVYIGSRDFDQGELDYTSKHQIPIFTYQAIKEMGLEVFFQRLSMVISKFDEIHLSFDLDVIDPREFGAVNIPVPMGFTKQEAKEIIQHLFQKYQVCSCDVVEYNPLFDHAQDIAYVVEMIAFVQVLNEQKTKVMG